MGLSNYVGFRVPFKGTTGLYDRVEGSWDVGTRVLNKVTILTKSYNLSYGTYNCTH